MDTVDRKTRSRIMSSVGQKDTGPEVMLRSALYREGLRYRLHRRDLPGSPDLVLPKHDAVVFVHGCYWHSHGCYKSTIPKSNREFWLEKFDANRNRDQRSIVLLLDAGWRVLVVWECVLIGKDAEPVDRIAKRVSNWLHGKSPANEIPKRTNC